MTQWVLHITELLWSSIHTEASEEPHLIKWPSVVSTAASQHRGFWFEPHLETSSVEFFLWLCGFLCCAHWLSLENWGKTKTGSWSLQLHRTVGYRFLCSGGAGHGPTEPEHRVLGAAEIHRLCHQRDAEDQPSCPWRLQSGPQDLWAQCKLATIS